MLGPSLRDERGSSSVEFVLVGALLTALTLAVLQLGLAVYVRNVLHDAAVEGAYHAALADVGPEGGAERTRLVIARAIGSAYAQDVSAAVSGGDIRVTVRSATPVVGLIGVPGTLEVTARAPVEIVPLVPLAYLVVALGVVQEHALGVEATARHAAHTLARTGGIDDTFAALPEVLSSVPPEYGIAPDALEVSVTCVPAHVGCPEAGSTVVVTIGARVPLPLVPPVLGLDRLTSIPVESTSVQKVSRFWGGT
ncbi:MULTISPECIES: TadE/TadG family type IV pilus assembly protein [unclassified Microbacterium]|uniref:TadE/TadG family type IV pilus assembly protein n=1 Tax=Microbacterium TaxID=33882 RepID=UPI003B9FDAA6